MRVVLLATLLAACGSASSLPRSSPRGGDPTRLVVDTDAAAKFAISEERLEIPFGQGENGTRLVLALMEHARTRGAAWVGGVEFLQVFKWRGQLIECSTPLARPAQTQAVPASAPADLAVTTAADGEPTYSSSVEPPRPRRASATVSEEVIHCQRHGQSRIEWVARYDNHNDVEVRRNMEYMPLDKTIVVDWKTECRAERKTREVERLDFQLRLGWQPPDWALLSPAWADEPIVDGSPRCYRVTGKDIGEPPRHRMKARLFFRSGFRDSGTTPMSPVRVQNET
jgi:hypothetical protein